MKFCLPTPFRALTAAAACLVLGSCGKKDEPPATVSALESRVSGLKTEVSGMATRLTTLHTTLTEKLEQITTRLTALDEEQQRLAERTGISGTDATAAVRELQKELADLRKLVSPAATGSTATTAATTPATARAAGDKKSTASKGREDLPYGVPVNGRSGMLFSPYAPDKGQIDVTGYKRGTRVECPYTGKHFRVP